MTTIAYHRESQLLAFDSRSTCDNVIINDDHMKMRRVGDDFMVFTGSLADENRFIDQLQVARPEKPSFPIDCGAMIVGPKGVFVGGVTREGEPFQCAVYENRAIGSGEQFALAAMDHGKGAKDALLYAMTRDSATGGRVHLFCLQEMTLLTEGEIRNG